MSAEPTDQRQRKARAVRLIVTRRERAPRSPKMERALKQLIWRYTNLTKEMQGKTDVQK